MKIPQRQASLVLKFRFFSKRYEVQFGARIRYPVWAVLFFQIKDEQLLHYGGKSDVFAWRGFGFKECLHHLEKLRVQQYSIICDFNPESITKVKPFIQSTNCRGWRAVLVWGYIRDDTHYMKKVSLVQWYFIFFFHFSFCVQRILKTHGRERWL